MLSIEEYLDAEGPQLAASVSAWLVSKGLSADAARKRVSRIKPPVRTFPVPLFPKGARFMYTQSQRTEERFWEALQRDLRSTGSVYGMALDGVLARRGAVAQTEFAVVSGATVKPVKKQVTAQTVLDRLSTAGLLTERRIGDESVVVVGRHELGIADTQRLKVRDVAERIILDGLREWASRNGAASYNQIRIRGELELQPIQQFGFDLTGPSYLLSLRRGKAGAPGFLVADVFAEGLLDEYHIRYFIRKAHALHATLTGATLLPILVADGFTGAALSAGHAAGIMMATPSTLFGLRVGKALRTLLETLNRAAAYASSDTPDRLVGLIDSLSEIEGRAGNLRGPLFELMAAYLARRDAVSIDMGVRATDPESGAQADIDVLKITAQSAECVAIECKGKEPGGTVSEEEVGKWLLKTRTIQAYLRALPHLKESRLSFELWTSGEFTTDALARLAAEKKKRTKFPICWKDGHQVLALATARKEKAIGDALRQHFLNNPLSHVRLNG
ncbi:hypothetical protein [Chromobacterium sp. Beijing]|uniref:hypothetical protein n=1 Tax=Chromobacterium sp. Beijing TaxID=2735795 RepID=UPI001F3F3B9B|nr:hypothetical protein [Chromobacterium sp. Beijing]UJB31377.1 hypothetical protein HQN78_10105 [Chromobacterium sp. Beijing]